jgi:Ni/Fe-hydrogenase subunit HybB-like protein
MHVLEQKGRRGWLIGLLISLSLSSLLLLSVGMLLLKGIGIGGVNQPVAWGFATINFAWWLGIGHAGTLIGATLVLLRHDRRSALHRLAGAMTLFALTCAGLYLVVHVGRPWLLHWLLPYPNSMNAWPNFRSPLAFGVFAAGTYALVSVMFWYLGVLPDLAALRDRAKHKLSRIVYGLMALGWRGSATHWQNYETAHLLLAGLAILVVVGVQTFVGVNLAAAQSQGWHAPIFPPSFLAGSIHGGVAMVVALSIPLRKFYKLHELITDRHMQNMAKVMLAASLVVASSHLTELLMAWSSAVPSDSLMLRNRLSGPDAPAFWSLLLFSVLIPQALWSRRVRSHNLLLFLIAISVNVGMWLERFVIVVSSLQRDYLPSSWGNYEPTFWDWSTYVGSLGLFFTLLLLFVRFFPLIRVRDDDREHG